jgi:YHS domain-containing protein
MRFLKMSVNVVPTACMVAMLTAALSIGQPTEKSKVDSTKTVMHAKQLKPQTTCPVLGEPIDKSLYVDYNGKRIYVCCADCIEKVKSDPEKYLKKLAGMGESVEAITGKSKKESKEVSAGDPAAKVADAGYWTCPMHPEIHKTESGQCPLCGMNLVLEKSDRAVGDKGKAAPVVHQKMKPQETCPVMGGKIDKTSFLDYKGKRVCFCCDGCKDPFNKDPEKYLKKMRDAGEEPEVLKK